MVFYMIVRLLASFIFRIVFRIEVRGQENIPAEGRLIICANHTSMLDPIMLAIAVNRPISFIAKKELFKNKFLERFFLGLGAIAVDREASDLSAIRNSLRVLKDEKILGIFPEGTRVDKVDLESAKSGIALMTIKGKAPILPIYIDTNYRLFSRVKITIGKEMTFHEQYSGRLNSQDYKNISQEIMKSIYSLKGI